MENEQEKKEKVDKIAQSIAEILLLIIQNKYENKQKRDNL